VLLSKTLKSSTLKLASIYMVVFCSAVFALFGYVYWITAVYVSDKLDRSIVAERLLLIETYQSGGLAGLIAAIERRVNDPHFADWAYLLADASAAHVAGNLQHWPAALRGDHGWSSFAQSALPAAAAARPLLRASHQIRVSYQTLAGGYRLLVGRDAADLARLRANITIGLAGAAALFLLLAAAAGISTSRRSVARIEAINATSRKIMRDGLGQRIPLRGTRDEWDDLARNLNSMLARIEELTESTRQVSDNVAHDLRTPLTRLRGRLERALSRSLDVAQYRALVADAIGELDGTLATFSSVLRISRIEHLDRTGGFRRLDLTAIAREIVDLFDPTAEENAVRLFLRAEGPAFVIGDRDLLFDAISNIVDNAIKHGGSGGEVTVSVAHGPGPTRRRPRLSVGDHGPGVPIAERDNILRRFYRLERSRHSPGNGLGLSLVAAVANLHGARIVMADNAPGLLLELRFRDPQEADRGSSEQPAVGQLASL
jgi:signal transduction histidine kinase